MLSVFSKVFKKHFALIIMNMQRGFFFNEYNYVVSLFRETEKKSAETLAQMNIGIYFYFSNPLKTFPTYPEIYHFF